MSTTRPVVNWEKNSGQNTVEGQRIWSQSLPFPSQAVGSKFPEITWCILDTNSKGEIRFKVMNVPMSVLWCQVDCHSTINHISNYGKGSATSTHSLDWVQQKRKEHSEGICLGDALRELATRLLQIRSKQSRTCQIVSESHESCRGMAAFSGSHGNDTDQIVWAAEYPHSILGKAVISDTFITCTGWVDIYYLSWATGSIQYHPQDFHGSEQ